MAGLLEIRLSTINYPHQQAAEINDATAVPADDSSCYS